MKVNEKALEYGFYQNMEKAEEKCRSSYNKVSDLFYNHRDFFPWEGSGFESNSELYRELAGRIRDLKDKVSQAIEDVRNAEEANNRLTEQLLEGLSYNAQIRQEGINNAQKGNMEGVQLKETDETQEKFEKALTNNKKVKELDSYEEVMRRNK